MDALLIVLPGPERLPRLLEALKLAGAPGATIYDSQGLEFLSWFGAHPSLGRLLGLEGGTRETSKTVLLIVPEVLTEHLVAVCEVELGGFESPYSGMLCSWKVDRFRCFQGDKQDARRPKEVHA